MVERIDRTKGLQAMIFLRDIVSIVSAALLIAAFGISVISLTTLLDSLIFNKRVPSTCFVFVWALCIISCGLYLKPLPTGFRLIGITTVLIIILEMLIRGANLLIKKIRQLILRRSVAASGNVNKLTPFCASDSETTPEVSDSHSS